METVHVDLPRNDYDILIGSDIDDNIVATVKKFNLSEEVMVVSDSNVGKIYAAETCEMLKSAGLTPTTYLIPAGEKSKSLAMAESVITRAIDAGLDRHSAIFALGGGVVGDLAGFVAATYMRGIPFFQMPTSLLAQVDSSVGGKVAVNHSMGKNLIGAFYQPLAVFVNLHCLGTLPKRELHTGLGEVIKYGVIYDADFFEFLEKHADDILSMEQSSIAHIVKRSCEIKADVVAKDERDNGLRGILNFGHTIGHAIEKETHYTRYNHGEAVAIGMIGAAELSRLLGLCDESSVKRVASLVERLHLPTRAEGCELAPMMRDILRDKKTVNGNVHWVLVNEIGRVEIRGDVPNELVEKAIQKII